MYVLYILTPGFWQKRTVVAAHMWADQGESNLLVIDDLSVLLLCQVSVGWCDRC